MMKRLQATFLFLLTLSISSFAQNSTSEMVYNILQLHCATSYCHANASQTGGLDLEGSGASLNDKMLDVYNNLVNADPSNATALAKGYKRVTSGIPQRSFLFQKINGGLQTDYHLDSGEGADMSGPYFGGTISDVEKEVLRQWILQGAPMNGNVVDTTILHDYYNGNGVRSMPNPPAPPAANEGFQVHLGPFFLEPEGETELYWKYPIDLGSETEITRVEGLFGSYSHHFILYKYDAGTGGNTPAGIREYADHSNISLAAAFQYSDTLALPEKTAFFWENNTILDLNSHYINYSSTEVHACDVYLNVYTQPTGTALEEMRVQLIPNTNIWIPNDGQQHTFETPLSLGFPVTYYLWGLGSHTHQWGTDFDVYTLDAQSNRDEHIFDASYNGGDPNSFFIGYDYQHPPIRYWDEFLPVNMGPGLLMEASYVNTGTTSVGWGNTSDDEMMLIVSMYVADTTGLTGGNSTTAIDDKVEQAFVSLSPNPADAAANLLIQSPNEAVVEASVYDLYGRKLMDLGEIRMNGGEARRDLDVSGLRAGMYLLRITNQKQQTIASRRISIH